MTPSLIYTSCCMHNTSHNPCVPRYRSMRFCPYRCCVYRFRECGPQTPILWHCGAIHHLRDHLSCGMLRSITSNQVSAPQNLSGLDPRSECSCRGAPAVRHHLVPSCSEGPCRQSESCDFSHGMSPLLADMGRIAGRQSELLRACFRGRKSRPFLARKWAVDPGQGALWHARGRTGLWAANALIRTLRIAIHARPTSPP
jgi:hypothetical protein